MRQTLCFSLFLLCLSGITFNSSAQQKDGLKQRVTAELQRQKHQRNFYRTILQVDSVKAMQVSTIQDRYKKFLRSVLADTNLHEIAKRSKIQELIEFKNKELKSILTPEQQGKVIPITENSPAIPPRNEVENKIKL